MNSLERVFLIAAAQVRREAGGGRREAGGERNDWMRDHTKLRAFELADQLACSIYKKTASCPKEEMFGLTSQLRLAAVSIASNIVEGSARQSKAEYIRFLDMAYGPIREVEYQIDLSHRLGFLCADDHHDLLRPPACRLQPFRARSRLEARGRRR